MQSSRPKVFVHLAENKDSVAWAKAQAEGLLVGRNDDTPYGYGRAEAMGCSITFSKSVSEPALMRLKRVGLRAALGYDLIHAWRQRDAMMASDVVWTHTESQFLAVSNVIGHKPDRPKILGQAVWLFDQWGSLSRPRRTLFTTLMRSVDVLTTHSHLNAELARRIFPNKWVEVVPFGIPSENASLPYVRETDQVKVLAVGNDRHRDWLTLVNAVKIIGKVNLQIFSATAPRSLGMGVSNINIRPAKSNSELTRAYDCATVAVVPLQRNLHASGMTVVQEAILAGIPVIVSDTGGLRSYFGEDEVVFVPVGDAAAMAAAIRSVVTDPRGAKAMAERAQRGLFGRKIGAENYIKRHVDITHRLIAC